MAENHFLYEGNLNIDSWGLIVTDDGGDSCANSCRYVYATWLNGRLNIEMLNAIMKHLELVAGIWRRHPWWFDDPCDFSRDQQTPLVILLEATGTETALKVLRARHEKRGWRYQNVDWATWEHRNYYTPKRRDWRGDALMLLNSLIRVVDSYLRPDTSCGIDLNHVMALLQVARSSHSRWTQWARRIYCWRRKGPQFAFDWYYRKDNPEIAKEFERPIKELILSSS